ncbi:hypothetical protein FBALC1_07583 [Flavobacteriales bacterium ALC-1]|nr:hypothetical protein FBALC1_07583 [Flavobacteriales bacterium ALC-1]
MTKIIDFGILFLFTFFSGFAQQLTLETRLDTTISETSGLLYLNNVLITHNDSGNANQLFDIDISTGKVKRTVTIVNATNTDWEDLTHDDIYIYIGDFGNYKGNRTDLKIYRISIADYFSSTSVTADIINFSYSNQTSFKSKPFNTGFDAEGLIHYKDKLYVFSKNWREDKIQIYELSKVPGTYSISIVDTIESEGLISGASYNTLNDSIMLCGYGDGAFLIQLKGFSKGLFSNGSVVRTNINQPENYSSQIEAIIPINSNEYYLSAEKSFSGNPPGLFSFNTSILIDKD